MSKLLRSMDLDRQCDGRRLTRRRGSRAPRARSAAPPRACRRPLHPVPALELERLTAPLVHRCDGRVDVPARGERARGSVEGRELDLLAAALPDRVHGPEHGRLEEVLAARRATARVPSRRAARAVTRPAARPPSCSRPRSSSTVAGSPAVLTGSATTPGSTPGPAQDERDAQELALQSGRVTQRARAP